MSALTPLEQRLGQTVDAERLRTAQATMQVIVASRRGPLRAVRKATAGSKALMLYDARGLLVGTVDLDGISEGVANQLEQFATRTPSTYQRDAITNPEAVRKASKTPAIAVYDSNGRLIGVVDSAKLNKVAKAGDVAALNAQGVIVGYCNEKDVRPLSAAPGAGTAKRTAAPTVAPAAAAGPVPINPTTEQVQKAMRLLKTPLRSGSPSEPELVWAVKLLQRVRERQAHRSAR